MNLTNHHAEYLTRELIRRTAAGTVEGVVNVLANARVGLNPSQVETALFAAQNPICKEIILAAETVLEKTTEASLLIAQNSVRRNG